MEVPSGTLRPPAAPIRTPMDLMQYYVWATVHKYDDWYLNLRFLKYQK